MTRTFAPFTGYDPCDGDDPRVTLSTNNPLHLTSAAPARPRIDAAHQLACPIGSGETIIPRSPRNLALLGASAAHRPASGSGQIIHGKAK